MSQVWVRLHWNGHTFASASHGNPLRRQNVWLGRIHLEERPRAAVAFKGDVPVLREPMHVAAAYTATDCAATKWICPPLPNLPSFSSRILSRSLARQSSWRSWRALREMGLARAGSSREFRGDRTPLAKSSTPISRKARQDRQETSQFPTFCENPIYLVGLRRSLASN